MNKQSVEQSIWRFKHSKGVQVTDRLIVETKRTVQMADGSVAEFLLSPGNETEFDFGVRVVFGELTIRKIHEYQTPNYSDIPAIVERVSAHAPLFQTTGAAHIAALYEDGRFSRLFEDVSRLSALYKLIGSLFLHPVLSHEVLIVWSGRLNQQIVSAMLTTKLPGVAAPSAPTDKAVITARRHHFFLAGFVRNNGMNIYSNATNS